MEGLVSLAETVGSSGRILIGVDDIIGTASKRLCMQWQKDSRAVELGLWMQINTFGEDTGICHRSCGKNAARTRNWKLVRPLETFLSLFLSSFCVFFILSPYQLLLLLGLCAVW